MVETIPLPVGTVLETYTNTAPLDVSQYCRIVGKLIYLCHTRPGLSYAVSLVSRFMHCLQSAHWEALQHILRYITFTKDFGIIYKKGCNASLRGFTDADYLSCRNTQWSIGAYVFQMASGPVSWSSKQQAMVSDSTTEAEYEALSEGAKEAVYIGRLLRELNVLPQLNVPLGCGDSVIHHNFCHASTPTNADAHLSCDNQGAVKLARNPVFHAKTKHIEAKHHFICERVLEGENFPRLHLD
jgi:hypothetical protein